MTAAKIIMILFFLTSINAQNTNNSESLKKTIEKFYKAIEENDVESRINLFSDDALIMPNHWTSISGIKDISEMIRSAENSVFKIKDRKIIRMEIKDGLAYTVNSYYYTYHAKEEEERWHKTKNVHIWKLDKNNNWKLTVDIWNSDVPVNKFQEEK